jgi:hypothetical protein
LQLTDISDALDKAIKYLDNSESDDPSVVIKSDEPFALRMRIYRFIKAYKIQMKDNEIVDENKYNHLTIKSYEPTHEVIITSSLEQQPLTLMTEGGEEL